jgi:hypothetical protein
MFHVAPAERNKEPILEILQKYIPKEFKGKALEIASGAGPHVVHFAQYYSNITWQPNATFNNISVISWRSVLLVEETGAPGENHLPAAIH